ncbi:MAG TPA: glycerol-3-phosphate dehydrogenase/oxidase [Candidatus Limnocylindrales bacterium]|nr:glycerol-3-phosphate dehydrogenase/oxidase [Candidatus Limnocylindrales bacterium]
MTAAPVEARRRDLAALVDRPLDVLVVGGGIVGCGAALDAATRGLRVGLVERDDIAVGTSSRSSRLIHGGLRYLEQYRFGLVREALTERSRILHLAPHLVTIEPLLFPLFGTPVVTRAFYQAGMTLYDMLGARKDGGWHRHLSVPEVVGHAPAMRRKGLRGGLMFHDGVEDDARYTLAVARSAQEDGATIVTRATAESLVEEGGRVVGARISDRLTDEQLEIRARVVIDATGVWGADPESPLSGGSTRLLPSRGAHLVVPRSRIPSDVGLTIRVPGKVVFLVPWPHFWLVGTTDAPYSGPIDRPTAGQHEVDELLAAVNHVLDVDLGRRDVVGTFAGLRPLIAPSGGSTITASREHRVVVEGNGLVRVSGGKYTTYRLMAQQTIDAALGVLGARAAERPTRTTTRRLVGAADRPELDRIAAGLAAAASLEPAIAARLVARHGTQAPEVVALGREAGLLGRLVDGEDHLEAEVAWAARHELALSIDDVLARRMRIVHELPDRAAAIAPRVAAILGAELGWDAARQASEIESFLAGARREFEIP